MGLPFRRFRFHIAVFILPAAAIYTIFMIYPLVDSLRLSLYGISEEKVTLVGLQNYVRLLTDPLFATRFWGALRHNVLFFVIHMLVQNPVALLLAALLSVRQLRGRTVFRTILFAPTVLSFVIVGFIWELILSPLWGIAAGLMRTVGLGEWFRPWLGGWRVPLCQPSR